MTWTSTRSKLGAGALLAILAAFAASPALATDGVATLGSPPPDEEQGVAAVAPVDPMEAMLDYAACMREHGIDMPDPNMNGGGFVIEIEATGSGAGGGGSIEDMLGAEFVAAERACSDLLGAMTSEHDPKLEAEIMEAMLAHAECMREQGIDMPDPNMSGGVMVMDMNDLDGTDGADFFSDEYVAAEEACRDVLPFGAEGLGFTDLGNE